MKRIGRAPPLLESFPDLVTAYHWSRHPAAPPSFSSFLPFFHSSILFLSYSFSAQLTPPTTTHTHQCLIHFPSTGLCAPWFICLWSLLTLSNTFLFFPSSPSSPALFWQSLWVLRGISMTSLSPTSVWSQLFTFSLSTTLREVKISWVLFLLFWFDLRQKHC